VKSTQPLVEKPRRGETTC